MDNSILDLKVGTKKRKVLINNVKIEPITTKEKQLNKAIFDTVDESTGMHFQISDAWVDGPKGIRIQGLWIVLQNNKGEISYSSTLGKLLRYYQVDTIKDLVGKEVLVHPDPENFLVMVACDLDQEN